jgi:hypothetical protein
VILSACNFLAFRQVFPPARKRVKRHQNSLHGASHSRLALEDAAKLDAERAPSVKAWEQSLYEKGFWWSPENIPEALDAKIDGDAPASQQLDELEGWLDRQKPHDAGDWPAAGEFTGGKHDRHYAHSLEQNSGRNLS